MKKLVVYFMLDLPYAAVPNEKKFSYKMKI